MSTATGRLNWPFAAAWATCTVIGWLAAVTALPGSESGAAGYFLAAILVQLITIGLRWPLLHRPTVVETSTDQALSAGWLAACATKDHELTWLLCWISQQHTVGIALLGQGISTALGLTLMLSVSEILLLRFAPPGWNDHLPEWWPAPFRPIRIRPDAIATEAENKVLMSDERDNADASAGESTDISASFHGRDENDLPFVHGWQRYKLAPGQKSMSLTIGFFPPFLAPPDCDLDHEGEENVSFEIEHITPAGARIAIKRRVATENTTGKLLWHCGSLRGAATNVANHRATLK